MNSDNSEDVESTSDGEITETESSSTRTGAGAAREHSSSFDYGRDYGLVHGYYNIPVFPCLDLVRGIQLSEEIKKMVRETESGLKKGPKKPELSKAGTGGTYLFSDRDGRYVSVFKPSDEEPNSKNNPKLYQLKREGFSISSKGIMVGGGAVREVAAYLLDHPKTKQREDFTDEHKGFSGVPPTIPISCIHKDLKYPKHPQVSYDGEVGYYKFGSLQKYMESIGSCASMSISDISKEEVHKICLLDIRLANGDRHGGNLLIGEGETGKKVLIPIDHGSCLPEILENCKFNWLNWDQVKKRFDQDFIDYIHSLDSNKDIDLLKRNEFIIPAKAARTLHISTMLLKEGVNQRLTPSAIGKIMCRGTKERSLIEKIVRKAIKTIVREKKGENFTTKEIVDQPMVFEHLGMTEEEFEKQLIETIHPIMISEIIKYKEEFGCV